MATTRPASPRRGAKAFRLSRRQLVGWYDVRGASLERLSSRAVVAATLLLIGAAPTESRPFVLGEPRFRYRLNANISEDGAVRRLSCEGEAELVWDAESAPDEHTLCLNWKVTRE